MAPGGPETLTETELLDPVGDRPG